MPNQEPSLKFDHREITVIFSLFVFVSLLMFTVGILVGKGLAQAKYEGLTIMNPPAPVGAPQNAAAPSEEHAQAEKPTTLAGASFESAPKIGDATDKPQETASPSPEPLHLVPQKEKQSGIYSSGLREPSSVKNPQAEKLLKDPKLRGLIESEAPSDKPSKLALANKKSDSEAKAGDVPVSFASGKFTVQVGSYPTEKDAKERVDSLKKLGFPFAYFSAKEIGDGKETWFRVWLGYFPDYATAKKSGDILQQQEEVKNYLVRKTDTSG